jgi:hypothetical protein
MAEKSLDSCSACMVVLGRSKWRAPHAHLSWRCWLLRSYPPRASTCKLALHVPSKRITRENSSSKCAKIRQLDVLLSLGLYYVWPKQFSELRVLQRKCCRFHSTHPSSSRLPCLPWKFHVTVELLSRTSSAKFPLCLCGLLPRTGFLLLCVLQHKRVRS